jgi:hypothetical protein
MRGFARDIQRLHPFSRPTGLACIGESQAQFWRSCGPADARGRGGAFGNSLNFFGDIPVSPFAGIPKKNDRHEYLNP